ncbi:hypothetical protein [Jiulongibacter sp. NS-SX5]|uniref:hypothetical protein n=1 Tax=Jiulongibacter sp. NS-SX5 TaxID=3463854 RepID=UPI00405870D3
MKLVTLSILGLSMAIWSCSTDTESSETTTETIPEVAGPSLEMVWQTDTTLLTPESVIYDAEKDVYYVSCMGLNPTGKFDGNGYIAKISSSGEILANPWISGLDDPKGLTLSGNMLYASDLNKVVSVNTDTEEVTIELADGAQYLNDAATGPDGEILFTDSDLNSVFTLTDGQFDLLYKNDSLGRLNGAFAEQERILLIGFNSGKLFSLQDTSLTLMTDGLMKGDGIEAWGDGYIISCWDGHIYYINKNNQKKLLVDTSADGIGAADIDIPEGKDLVVVPTFHGHNVVAYKIK